MEKNTPNRLSGHTILFVSLPRHDAKYTSTTWQLAQQFAKTNRVILVDHPYSFSDLISKFREGNTRKRALAYLKKDTFVKDDVHVLLAPFIWPVNFLPKGKVYDYFSALNQRIVAKRINTYLQFHEIKSMIYINSFNFYLPELDKFLTPSFVLKVYHCIDPMVKAFTLKHGPYLQERAASRADIIVSTAPALMKQFEGKTDKNFLVANAANFNLFNRAVLDRHVHPRLQVSGKVLGYLGNIERRIDFRLLEAAMNLLPEWTLVLAGPVEKQYIPEGFSDHPRVRFAGSFKHEEAPSVVRRFDVAIIPFKNDEVSRGIFPLKLYEYLAAGKPVVSTNFNPDILSELHHVVHVAESSEEFAKAVLLAYATDSEEKIKERIAIASQHTWETRAAQFGEIIQHELDLKNIAIEPLKPMKTPSSGTLKDKIRNNPKLKKFILSLIFRKKPYGSRVRWYIWLWLIFPRYFQRGVSWASRLDLVPFNKFKVGKYARIEQGVVINNGMGDVIIHDEVHTGIGCVIIGPVTLHKHVGLSQYVRVLGMHHGSDADSPHHYQRAWKAPVILEEDAFIGTGTVIMGKKNGEPLTLGRYCRVGANAVVTTDIPPYSVAVGNPAKVVRVWDFEKKCWIKPPSERTASKAIEKIEIPPSLLSDPGARAS